MIIWASVLLNVDSKWCFDNLRGSHLFFRVKVNRITSVETLVIGQIGQLSLNVIGHLSLKLSCLNQSREIISTWFLWVKINDSMECFLITYFLLDKLFHFILELKILFPLRWLDPVFLGGYHPSLKLSGIPTFTFNVSLTHKMDNI